MNEQSNTQESKSFPTKLKTWLPIAAYTLMILVYLPMVVTTYVAPYWTLLLPFLSFGLSIKNIRDAFTKPLSFEPFMLPASILGAVFIIGSCFDSFYKYAQNKELYFFLAGIEYGVVGMVLVIEAFVVGICMWRVVLGMVLVHSANVAATTDCLNATRNLLASMAAKMNIDKNELLSQEWQHALERQVTSLGFCQVMCTMIKDSNPSPVWGMNKEATNANTLPAANPQSQQKG